MDGPNVGMVTSVFLFHYLLYNIINNFCRYFMTSYFAMQTWLAIWNTKFFLINGSNVSLFHVCLFVYCCPFPSGILDPPLRQSVCWCSFLSYTCKPYWYFRPSVRKWNSSFYALLKLFPKSFLFSILFLQMVFAKTFEIFWICGKCSRNNLPSSMRAIQPKTLTLTTAPRGWIWV